MFARFLLISLCLSQLGSAFVPATTKNNNLRSIPPLTATKPKIFIDGEAGTTGLQVRDRLAKRTDLELISAPDELRKDVDTRKKLLNEADAVILCTFLLLLYRNWRRN